MLLFIKIKFENNKIPCEARRKFLARGEDKIVHGGTQIFFGWGGQALMGGLHLHGGVPPIPPILDSPAYILKI